MVALMGLGTLSSLSQGVLADFKIFGLNFFDLFDFMSANVFMTGGGLLLVIFVGWKLKRADFMDEMTNSGTLNIRKWLLATIYFIVKYVAPVVIITIMIANLIK
jgi:NSS family neurotransmitter:Na+ symporter